MRILKSKPLSRKRQEYKKSMIISKSKPLSRKELLSLIDNELQKLRAVAESLSEKIGDGETRCVFKTTVPTSTDGSVIANIRNNLLHVRCCINSIACGTDNKRILDSPPAITGRIPANK